MIDVVVRRISSSVFVGRAAERAQLEAGLDAAERGEAGLILLGGDAGIGKTRLADELAVVAARRGAFVVRGRCFEANAVSLPFGPFIEILQRLVTRTAADVDGARPAGSSPLVELLVQPAGTAPRSPADDDRLGLFHAVLELIMRVAEQRPLVVVIEDLQWADELSLDLLHFIADGITDERLLVIGTFRSDELHRTHRLLPVVAELVRLAHVVRLDLEAFSRADVADQLTGITGERPADAVIDRVVARSDGNPFFVEEVMGLATGRRLPASLRDVLRARMSGLSSDARSVVIVAAAVGRDVTEQEIGPLVPLPDDRLLDALRDAVASHVLVPSSPGEPAGFAFRHALIQEAAYDELLPSERVRLHRAIVESIRDAGGRPGEVARHALLGHDLQTGLLYSVRAADETLELLAFAEALRHAERALELWNQVVDAESLTGHTERSVLMLAARSASALGRWTAAAAFGRSALERLDPIEERNERVVGLLELSRWEMLADDEEARAAALHEAAVLVPVDRPTALQARVLAELAHLSNHNNRFADAERLAGEAISVARAVGARDEEARALIRLAETMSYRIRPEATERLLAEVARIVAEGDEPGDDFPGYLMFRQAGCALERGAFGQAIEIVDAGLARALRTGRFGERSGFLRGVKIQALVALGRWTEAEGLVDDVRRGGVDMASRMAVQDLVVLLVRQGRVEEAAEAVRAIDTGYSDAEEGRSVLATRIRVANAAGRWDDARAAADEAVSLLHDDADPIGFIEVLDLSVGAEADRAELASGRRRAAEAADARRVGLARLALGRRPVEAAIELGDAGPMFEAILATAVAEGSRLDGRSDATLWDDAARRRAALELPWETAYARFRQAEAILFSGADKAEAIVVLREAHRIASNLRAGPLVRDIEALARRGRIRLVAAAPASGRHTATTADGIVVALTTRESDVLSLVAAGHTNREIGETLFISEKTASVHISNVMDKLGALSRYEAAAIATRLGLLDAIPGTGATR